MITMARKNVATSLLKVSRCLVAVTFSPAGVSPDGVVRTGLTVPAAAEPATGLARFNGISVTFCSWRSLAAARRRADPPRVHLTSPYTEPVVLLNVTCPSLRPFATASYTGPPPLSFSDPPRQVERGDSAYTPPMPVGIRGLAAPGSGGSRLRAAVNGMPPSVPAIAPLAPETATAFMLSCRPAATQSTVPVRRWPPATGSVPSRSWPDSVPWLLPMLTNWPDCWMLNDGPAGFGCAGAVAGSGAPGGVLAGLPRQAFAGVASYPPPMIGWAFSFRPRLTTKTTPATVI